MSQPPISDEEADHSFDFDSHRASAEEAYRQVRGGYVDYAHAVSSLLGRAIEAYPLKVQSIEQRAKTESSFGTKAARESAEEPGKPKYTDPLTQIQDLAGCRIITFFLRDVQTVRSIIQREFAVIESVNRSSQLRGAGRPGYESYHFIVEMSPTRLTLPEYARFRGMQLEIQVRTILQHAWAEIEHDIQYKSVDSLPSEIGQRFVALAGMIEIGDREFQSIADSYDEVRDAARQSFKEGRLADIELTDESLHQYLDDRLGPDRRMREWSYNFAATVLKRLGFTRLDQLDSAIKDYDSDAASRAVYGSRQGQVTRLELIVLAAVGPERYLAAHPWANDIDDTSWFIKMIEAQTKLMRRAGIPIATYIPGSGPRNQI